MIKRCVKSGRLQKIDRIDLYKRLTAQSNEVSPQKSVLFGYETDVSKMLCPGIPNGFLENNGKLTLRNVTFRLNDAIAMPPYRFTYYKEGGDAPYNREHWDRWGYYKSDGGLIPVKIARRNIASWKDVLEYLDNLPPEGSPGRDANIGMVLRDTLKTLLSKKDLRILLNTPVEELLDPESGKFKPLHKDAIAEAIDRLRRDKNLFYRYRWGYGFLKLVDAKTGDLNDYIYPNCNEYYTSLTSGDNPIMEADGLVRGDLLQWELNRVVAFNMALLSEMCFLKDENDPTMPVTENDRAVMKHLEINRMDHEPNKEDVIAWSLKNVTTPSGAKLNVEYESDDFTYVGRTRAVVPNEKQKFDADGTISEEDMTDMSFYKFIGMEKDLISKNNVLRVNFSENSSDVLEQDGTLALDDIVLRVSSLFRVWRKVNGQWQLNEDFRKMKTDPNKFKLHLLAMLDPDVFSSFMVNPECQTCGTEEGKTDERTSGKAFTSVPVVLGEVKKDFELNDPGENGEYACQWNEVEFKIKDLELPQNWEQKIIYNNGAYDGTCRVTYFRGIMEQSNHNCDDADKMKYKLIFPGEKQQNYQYNFTWGRKIDFNDPEDVAQNLPAGVGGLDQSYNGVTLTRFGINQDKTLYDAATAGEMEECYIDINDGEHKGYFSWSYFTENGVTSAYDAPVNPGVETPPPFEKKYWDYYSIINHLKLQDPEVAGHVAGIIGGGVRVKRLAYESGWPVRSGQPPVTSIVDYEYVCEARNGKPGNYSSGATASLPPPYSNQGDDRTDIPPQIGLLQGAPKVTYGTVHEIRPGRGRIIYNYLTSADVSDFFADDSLNYWRNKEDGSFQVVFGAYNSDPSIAMDPMNPHHRYYLHRVSSMQGLMYNEKKFGNDGTLVNEKKIKYLTSLTRNDICNLDLIGKMNYIDTRLSTVLVPMEKAVAGAGTSEEMFKVHPLYKDIGTTRERFRMRWLYNVPYDKNEDDAGVIRGYIGLEEVEAIEHAVHQYSVQTTVDGVGTRSINSFFDFLTGEPLVTTITEALHSEKDNCGCYGEDVEPQEEVSTATAKTTVSIPAYWIEEHNSGEAPMLPVFNDPNFRDVMNGKKSPASLKHKNFLLQPYSTSVYSGLQPFPACCGVKQEKWVQKLTDINDADDTEKSSLLKRTVTTWKQFDGSSSVWRKEREIVLRADMTPQKRIDELPADLGFPWESPTFFKEKNTYVTSYENLQFDAWGRPVEIRDAYNSRVASFYNSENCIPSGHLKDQYPGLYMTAQVLNSDKASCAVLTVDEMFQAEHTLPLPQGWSTGGIVYMSTAFARSGAYSLKAEQGGTVRLSLPGVSEGTYHFSFWIKGDKGNANVAINGNPAENVSYTLGRHEWQQYAAEFGMASNADIVVSCTEGTVFIDDLRFAPSDAQVYSITYNNMGQTTSYAGPDDNIVILTYDNYGRLTEVRDFQGVLVSTQAQLEAR